MKRYLVHYATLGPIGYQPASGTLASLVTMLCLFCMPPIKAYWYLLSCIILYIISHISIKTVLTHFKSADPSEIVIDELVGSLITFYGVTCSASSLLIGFLLFRFFDIFKIWPIHVVEKYGGPAGIMLDDVVAGIVSNLVLKLIIA